MSFTLPGAPSRRRQVAVGAAMLSLLAATLVVATSASAGPSEKSISLPSSPGTHTVSYTGTAPFNNDQDGLIYGQLGLDDPKQACDPSNTTLNDQQKIRVVVPPSVDKKYDTLIRFGISWTPLVNEPLADLALYLYGPDGKLVAASDGSQNSEGINLTSATPGVYDLLVCSFQNLPQGQAYTGTVTAMTLLPATYPAAKLTKDEAPTYRQYEAPKGKADNAGEPSIGNSWVTGHNFYVSNTDVYDVAFNDRMGTSTWKLVNTAAADTSNKISLDPIGFTDSVTGRTFISQLYLACSGMAYTDDDFKNTNIAQGCGSGVNGFDHQTVGGGPYPQGVSPLPTSSYKHAVYYCSQGAGLFLGGATCARSDTGGTAFNPPINTWVDECSGIHGHVRVGPDGAVYLPNANCGGKQGVAVSLDGGTTWKVRTIPDSVAGSSDPSVAAGSDGTVYYGYSDGTGKPRLAVSRDHGAHWAKSVDMGVPTNVHNSEFAEVIAGDGKRAAFAFLGTPTRGSTQAASFGKNKEGDQFLYGAWHLYIATTYDRGAHWTTVDATPKDPVQRGCIWNSGGSNPCRNLLDFNDITIDKRGYVMVAFADGCVGPEIDARSDCVATTEVSANRLVQHGAVIRQLSGKGLFAAYDPKPAATTRRPTGHQLPAATATAGRPGQPVLTSGAAELTARVNPARTASRTPIVPIAGILFLVLVGAVTGGRWRRRHNHGLS